MPAIKYINRCSLFVLTIYAKHVREDKANRQIEKYGGGAQKKREGCVCSTFQTEH